MVNKATVQEFDLKKYLGTWYEIARFPHSFEKRLVGVTATYTLRNDGKVNVINQGHKDSIEGKVSTAKGKAKLVAPGRLKVSFFLFFYAEYNILELDPDYKWALIGSSSSKYLWILSRNPQMDSEIYNMIVSKAKARGYDTGQLQQVLQPKITSQPFTN